MNDTVDQFDGLHGYYFEDLKEGMSDSYAKTVTETDIVNFAGTSGDTNPAHLNKEFAAKTMFKDCIAHGMLSVGFISATLGTKLPGPGAIYVAQNLRFKAPVKAGDTVTARVTITKLVPEKRFVELETVCTVGGKPVIVGEATMMVSSREA
ncbi:MAG: MaoC family dehydratase [Rhodospirillales bacterium]|jgi:3-hydroxybutyryl-CoA dehydratase|nr:MaoC family dehydratase [Rhodospirillales bacterium]